MRSAGRDRRSRTPAGLFAACLLWLGACSQTGTLPQTGASQGNVIAAALASSSRSAVDRERDTRDQPLAVLTLADFRPEMTVADVFGGGGYYAEILAGVVGSKGRVRLINNAAYDRQMGKEVAQRLAGDRLPNVRYEVSPPADMKLGTASLDGAMIVMSYHDLYFADPPRDWPVIDASGFIDQIVMALKPGAALLIVDHAARPGSGRANTQDLHRIDEAYAIADFKGHGLELVGSIDALRNTSDDHRSLVFHPSIRHKTDRFVHLYRKPN